MHDNPPKELGHIATDEAASAEPQCVGEDVADEGWTDTQEMLSVALDRMEDDLFALTGVERTHEALAELSDIARRLLGRCCEGALTRQIPGERDGIAMSFMAVGLARRLIEKWENPQEAFHLLAEAGYALGVLEGKKLGPSLAGRVAAEARHARSHAIAASIKAWWLQNGSNYKSMDAAAEDVTAMMGVAFRTARKHIGHAAKELRATRKQ